MARIPDEEIDRLKREIDLAVWSAAAASSCAPTARTCSASVPSTTITTRRWSSRRRRTSGTAWARARAAGR